MKSFGLSLLVMASSAIMGGCSGIPSGVSAVEDFDIQRYQGAWREIARLDHRFERGLTHVSATYTPRSDGGITVVNRGYDSARGQWKDIRGRAYFLDEADKGRLKVTFFWPFYGAYNVIALDRKDYSHAMVCGPNRDYLWILAREGSLPAPVLESLISQAGQLGFRVEDLILVSQRNPPPLSGADADHDVRNQTGKEPKPRTQEANNDRN